MKVLGRRVPECRCRPETVPIGGTVDCQYGLQQAFRLFRGCPIVTPMVALHPYLPYLCPQPNRDDRPPLRHTYPNLPRLSFTADLWFR